MDSSLQKAIMEVANSPMTVISTRSRLLTEWGSRAQILLQESDWVLVQIKDEWLRRLLRGVPDGAPPKMGTTCNIELYKELSQAVRSVDHDLPSFLLSGFPIVGPIAPFQRWPAYQKEQTIVELTELKRKVWDIRKKFKSSCGPRH